MPFGYNDTVLNDIRRRANARQQGDALAAPPEPQDFGSWFGSLASEAGSGLRRGVNALSDNPEVYDLPPKSSVPAPSVLRAPWEAPGPDMPDFSDVSSDASTSLNLPMPGVSSGASSTAGPSVGELPPPPPSSLRYQLPGGEWQEYGEDSVAPQIGGSSAFGREYQPASNGGTVSMLTAPENVDLVTRGSQLEDAQFASQIQQLQDPTRQQREATRFGTDEAIRLAEAQDRIGQGKQARLAMEQQEIQQMSDAAEVQLAQRYGVDPRDTEGSTLDDARRQQYMAERESLKRQVQARVTMLLSRYGMAPKSNAGFEALSGF
jgi:hypothetical protein